MERDAAAALPEPGVAAWLVYAEGAYEWLPPASAAAVLLRLCQLRDAGHPALREDAPPVDPDADGTFFLVTVRGVWWALDGTLRADVEAAAFADAGGVRGAQWLPYARDLGMPEPPPPPGFDAVFEAAVEEEDEPDGKEVILMGPNNTTMRCWQLDSIPPGYEY